MESSEQEQERLRRLLEEVMDSEIECDDNVDDIEAEHIEQRKDYSNIEQASKIKLHRLIFLGKESINESTI